MSCATSVVGSGSAGLAMGLDGRAPHRGWLALAVHLRVPIVIGVGVNVVFPPALSVGSADWPEVGVTSEVAASRTVSDGEPGDIIGYTATS